MTARRPCWSSRSWGSAVLVGILLSLLLVGGPATAEGTLRTFKPGDFLPDIDRPLLVSHKRFTFSPGHGKPAAVVFFSVRPEFRKKRSLALIAALDDLAARLGNRAAVIGVFSDRKGGGLVRSFLDERAIRIPVVDDGDRRIYNAYGVFMMPLVVIVDAKGALYDVIPYTYNIRELVEGDLRVLLGDWTKEEFEARLAPKKESHLSKEDKEFIRRLNYGRVMMSRKMYDKAVREFSVAVQLKPKAVDGYVELGFAQLALERYAAAEATFKKALRIDSESDDALAGHGLALYHLGREDEALAELENAIIAPKPRLEVIITLADLHEKRGNITRAMRLNKLAVSRLLTLYEHRWQEE